MDDKDKKYMNKKFKEVHVQLREMHDDVLVLKTEWSIFKKAGVLGLTGATALFSFIFSLIWR